MKLNRALVNLFGLCILGTPALGHEFWLNLSKYSAQPGEVVQIQTMVGDGFPGESRPRDPTKLMKFELLDSAGSIAIMGMDGADPAGIVRAQTAGTYTVGYLSKPTRVVLAGEKFELYLKEEGLDNATALRKEAGKQAEDGKERFSRCAKAILSVGDDRGAGFDKVLGYPIELCADSHPALHKLDEEMIFTVLAESKPAVNVLVKAVNKDDPTRTLSARSDEKGKVKFKLDKAGLWRLNAVKIAPVTEKGGDCDWESHWASLTFEITGAPTQAPATESK